MGRRRRDYTGERFGRLVVLGCTRGRPLFGEHRKWYCQCDCGNLCCVNMHSLKAGKTQSCGCLRNERAMTAVGCKEGDSSMKNRSKVYVRWNNMMQSRYDVCDNWQEYLNFKAWWDMQGYKRTIGYIMRIKDRNKPYGPDNVRIMEKRPVLRNTGYTMQIKIPKATRTLIVLAYLRGERIVSLAKRFIISKQSIHNIIKQNCR